MTSTKGTVIMNSLIIGYQPMGTELKQLRNGVLVALKPEPLRHMLCKLQKSAELFLSARQNKFMADK
jgi:predicted membrane GTPase involved in stress response